MSILILCKFLFISAVVLADPWSVSEKSPVLEGYSRSFALRAQDDEKFRPSFWDHRFDEGYYFYQKVISPADGARCGFYPTCADYSYQAIHKHGPIWGTWMSTDRFMRDHGHNEGSYDLIEKYGKRRFYDPVAANDFWFSEGDTFPSHTFRVWGDMFPSRAGSVADAHSGKYLPTLPTSGEGKVLSPPDSLLQFADSLFREGDYYRAITEYKRFVFLHPKHPKSDAAKFLIGFSYLKGEKWDAAIQYFDQISLEEAKFLTGQAHFLANRFAPARAEWHLFLEKYSKSKLNGAIHYQHGWSYFLEEENERAKNEFRKVAKTFWVSVGRYFPERASATLPACEGNISPHTPNIEQSECNSEKSHAEKMIEEIDRWNDHPRRSPLLAGMMSAIFPGSGQWYTGRFWDGCSALVLNSIFIYGIYKTVDEKLYIPAGILSFFGLGFYGGNIFSAVSGAHKFNRNVKESHWQRLKIQHGLKFKWENGGLTLHF